MHKRTSHTRIKSLALRNRLLLLYPSTVRYFYTFTYARFTSESSRVTARHNILYVYSWYRLRYVQLILSIIHQSINPINCCCVCDRYSERLIRSLDPFGSRANSTFGNLKKIRGWRAVRLNFLMLVWFLSAPPRLTTCCFARNASMQHVCHRSTPVQWGILINMRPERCGRPEDVRKTSKRPEIEVN